MNNSLPLNSMSKFTLKTSAGTKSNFVSRLYTPAWLGLLLLLVGIQSTQVLASSPTGSPLNWSNLPSMVGAYGYRKAATAAKATNTDTTTTKTSANRRAFMLTERDLTPGNTSDEREPVYRSAGDKIAFASNGEDSNGDARIDRLNSDGAGGSPRYHLWIMDRDGSNLIQITGRRNADGTPGADTGHDQRHPSWAPSGNDLVYIEDEDGNSATLEDQQLYIVTLNLSATTTPVANRLRITSFPGEKRSPAWGGGTEISFATNRSPEPFRFPVSSFDIFTVDNRNAGLVRQLTGGPNDPIGNEVDDLNPAYSLVNRSVIYFSSNREIGGALAAGRRIWVMSAIDGQLKRQITNPLFRPRGSAGDIDDNPAPSLVLSGSGGTFGGIFNGSIGAGERLAFQSNSLVDNTDTTKDFNVWTVRANSNQYAPIQDLPRAALMVSSPGTFFNNGVVKEFDAESGEFIRDFALDITNPAGLGYGPDITGDGYPEFFVSNRFNDSVDRFNGVSGQYIDSIQGGELTEPTALTFGPDGDLFVASAESGQVYRFDSRSRQAQGAFLSGDSAVGDAITGGIEGLTFGPDANDDQRVDLYVSDLIGNKVNVYDGVTGEFIRVFAQTGTAGTPARLVRPTGLTFGPDGNLYVSSSGNDAIKVYDGTTGAFLRTLVTFAQDPTLDSPQGLRFGTDGNLYVGLRTGGRVNRYGADGTPVPAPDQTGSTFISGDGLTGGGYLVFNPVATGAIQPPDPNTPALETLAAPALLETSLLSSPQGRTQAGYAGASEDQSNDVEPDFSQLTANPSLAAQFVFASQRRTQFAPGSNPDLNPGGGTGPNATYDIWSTSVKDYTPPILVPHAAGGQLYPFVAPGPQSPFFAPRTAEEGLAPGGVVTIGVVLQDLESGLQRVTATIKDANRPRYSRFQAVPDDPVVVQVANELPPTVVVGPVNLTVHDDGPAPGGHEVQSNAVAGDGIYYCQAQFASPNFPSDYYVDIEAIDTEGNSLLYDHVFGFSTKTFSRENKVLFVSDYTVGQSFASELSGFAPRSSTASDPVESHLLSNPGGTIVGHLEGNGVKLLPQPIQPVDVDPPPGVIDEPVHIPADISTITTTDAVDVWRILSRGPVSLEILRIYSPTITEQLDPTAGEDLNGDGGNETFVKTRKIAIADAAVIWGAPYTGNVFASPGTLYDAETQRRLTEYLETGGRLFVTGKEIAYALSNAGTVTNTFLENELNARFANEVSTGTIEGPSGSLIIGGYRTDYREDSAFNQENMDVITPLSGDEDKLVSTMYTYGGEISGVAGQRVTTRNRASGVESRLIYLAFGLEGVNRQYRMVTDGGAFGLQCLNKRAHIVSTALRSYFWTGRISGRVVNAATNLPIPNFLVAIGGGTVGGGSAPAFIAKTNANGEYEVAGVPPGGYSVKPLEFTKDGVITSLNGAYLPSESEGAIVSGGALTSNINFRVIPSPPGSVRGRAVSDKGTAADTADDTNPLVPIPRLPVLIRSLRDDLPATDTFPAGGRFAALVETDLAGQFSISNVPSNVDYEIIFNPRPGTINTNNPSQGGDIPAGSNIEYPSDTIKPNLEYDRRVIPADAAYQGEYTGPKPILIPVGGTVDVGDVPVPTAGTVVQPTPVPTTNPTTSPTANPTTGPTTSPTANPTTGPTTGPTASPTTSPTTVPTVSPTPGPTGPPSPNPGATPTPAPAPEIPVYQAGLVYQISIPYANTTEAYSNTSVDAAFTVSMLGEDGTVNFTLHSFDPIKQQYVRLSPNSALKRGEGYFLRPITQDVSLRTPFNPGTSMRQPTSVTEFDILLRRDPSRDPLDPDNGYNLIGFPFDPEKYGQIDWTISKVTAPDGRVFNTLNEAAAAGVVSSTLQTLQNTSGNSYNNTKALRPFIGYFARTYLDNVTVTLKARSTTTTAGPGGVPGPGPG